MVNWPLVKSILYKGMLAVGLAYFIAKKSWLAAFVIATFIGYEVYFMWKDLAKVSDSENKQG
jgi:hypothetical protein